MFRRTPEQRQPEPAHNAPTPEELAQFFNELSAKYDISTIRNANGSREYVICHNPVFRGGFGELHWVLSRGKKPQLGLAKFLRPENRLDPLAQQQLHTEYLIQSRAIHPHIAKSLDPVEFRGQQGFVQEFVGTFSSETKPGQPSRLSPHSQSLEDVLKTHLQPVELARIGDQVISVAEYLAQRTKGCHFDLTPANLLVDQRSAQTNLIERIKVVDFGIHTQVADYSPQADFIVGSPPFLSPERARRKVVIDQHEEVFGPQHYYASEQVSIAATLYALVDPEGMPYILRANGIQTNDSRRGQKAMAALERYTGFNPENVPMPLRQNDALMRFFVQAMALRPQDRFHDLPVMNRAWQNALKRTSL